MMPTLSLLTTPQVVIATSAATSDNRVGIMTTAGPRLNKKDGLTRYGDSHVKDKTS